MCLDKAENHLHKVMQVPPGTGFALAAGAPSGECGCCGVESFLAE